MTRISLILGALGLVLLLLSAAPGQASAPAPTSATAREIAYGRALFAAKGCVTCHYHAALPDSGAISMGAPNLTRYQVNPEFLRAWLRDPSALRPGTAMPTLGLKDGEIAALIAFLGAQGGG